MALLTTTTVTATVTGSRLKCLSCKSCGGVYYYTITRTASGRREDGIFTTETEARAAAMSVASAALNRRLDREHDVVPCPTCRHVQPFMVEQERARRAGKFLPAVVFAGLGLVVGSVLGGHLLIEALTTPRSGPADVFLAPTMCLFGAFGCFVGFLYTGMQWRAGRRYDPNRNPFDFPRGLTTNQPMTLAQYEDSLRRQATEAIAVLGRPVPFGDPEALDRWTAAQGVVRLAAKELNDANLAGWAKVEAVFAHPPAVASQPPAGPNPFQFT